VIACPWAAGGGTDRVAKRIAALLQEDLGVNVDVQNVTGGEGVTGHSFGALAQPDGYTLTLMTIEINMLRWRGRTKLSYRDFAPAVLVNRDVAALFVRSDAPWKTLKELEADIRKEPGRLRASGTAAGGIWHLGLAGWLRAVGLKPSDVTWVPSQGSTPALRDLLARGIEIVGCSVPEARAFLANGDVRCLGVMGDARHPLYPDIPTFKEQGAEWSLGIWRGVGLPAATPRHVIDRIVPALERVVRSERFLDYMKSEGFGAACEGPAEFEASLSRTDEQMRALLTHESMRSLSQSPIGPMAFPTVLGIGLVVVLAALAATRGSAGGPPASSRAPEGAMRFAETLGWVAAYVLVSPWLGYLLTVAALLLLFLWRMGTRLPLSAAIGTGLSAGTYLLFATQLRVPLPRGILGW
jgi:tripartite-type tricarboxylate transporter receptor subunit TctC